MPFKMGGFHIKGNPNIDPKYTNPSYADPQKRFVKFGKPPNMEALTSTPKPDRLSLV